MKFENPSFWRDLSSETSRKVSSSFFFVVFLQPFSCSRSSSWQAVAQSSRFGTRKTIWKSRNGKRKALGHPFLLSNFYFLVSEKTTSGNLGSWTLDSLITIRSFKLLKKVVNKSARSGV